MQNNSQQPNKWHKYLIYFNLALALLLSSNAHAQNSDTVFPKPKAYDTLINEWQHAHDSLFAQPTQIKIYKVSAEYYMQGAKAIFHDLLNEVVVLVPSKKHKTKAVKQLMAVKNLSYAEADSMVSAAIKMGQNKDFIRLITEHEMSHAEDWEMGIFKPDISLKKFIQLNALTEIKATMTEAGLALQHYKKTGDLSHFAYVNLHIDTLALQNDLRAGKAQDNPELYVANYIFDKWLEQYNCPNTVYAQQLSICADGRGKEVMSQIKDSPLIYREYLTRVRKMFADVKGLGNVNQVVNPDFDLHPQLQQQINSEMERNATPQQAAVEKPQAYNMAQHILSAKAQEK